MLVPGSIFSTNNITVYGSVVTASVNVAGSGYTTGIKTTTGGSGTGLVINVTAVGGGGTISTFTISNVGADYKVGDIVDEPNYDAALKVLSTLS